MGPVPGTGYRDEQKGLPGVTGSSSSAFHKPSFPRIWRLELHATPYQGSVPTQL